MSCGPRLTRTTASSDAPLKKWIETLLNQAVQAGLKNEDGRARGSIGSVYSKLTFEEIKPLLPGILDAIHQPAPSGEMFADGIRMEGLKVLAQHHWRRPRHPRPPLEMRPSLEQRHDRSPPRTVPR